MPTPFRLRMTGTSQDTRMPLRRRQVSVKQEGMKAEKYCPKCFKRFASSLEKCPTDGQHLVSLMERDLTGEVLDERYTVLGLVGKGGMGVVYKAEQALIKRIVALKVLRREVVQDETSVKRFLNEARAIASLENPHTITLYDFGVTRDGLLYYTMELLKGTPLSRLIKREAPLDYRRAVGFILETCGSLQEAHESNILHRDLKPDNLFIIKRWEEEHVKVLDFGIAKLVGDTSMETMTKTGMIVGTPQYLSPEQALGNPSVPASDLYSLAIVLYEMLTGSPPFLGDTPLKTMWKHLQEQAPPIHVKNPNIEVPKSIDLFLRRALQKEPGKRPQTALAFRKALEKALNEHDAAPETVALRSLSATENGVRIITEPLEAQKPGGPPSLPSQESALAPTAAQERPARDKEMAKPDSTKSEEKTPDAAEKEQPESFAVQVATVLTPGIGTQALMRDVRGGNKKMVLAGIAIAVVAIALLAVWQPWAGGGKEHDESKAERIVAGGPDNVAPSGSASLPITQPDVSAQPDSSLAATAADIHMDTARTPTEPASTVASGTGGAAAVEDEAKAEPGKAEETVAVTATADESLEKVKQEADKEEAAEKARAEAEEKAKAKAEKLAEGKAEQERRKAEEVARRAAERKAKEKADAGHRARADKEKKLAEKNAAEQKTKSEAEAEAEKKAKAKARAKAEARARAEAEAKKKAEARKKAEAETRKKAEAKRKAEAEKKAKEEDDDFSEFKE